jgi:peptide/nickel transport system substrate-binding protein
LSEVRRQRPVATSLGTPSVHAQKDRQTLRFVPHAELKILDPVWTTTYITRNHGYLVYGTLIRHG